MSSWRRWNRRRHPVLDDGLHPEEFLEFRLHHARHQVGGAAGRERHDDADRLRGVGLGQRDGRKQEQRAEQAFHSIPSQEIERALDMKVVTDVAGKVWKIEAKPGAQLSADDVILILESMKMEIPVVAPKAGKLLELRVKEGDTLNEGEVIALME